MTDLLVRCLLPDHKNNSDKLAEGSLLQVSCAVAPLIPAIEDPAAAHVLLENLLEAEFSEVPVSTQKLDTIYRQEYNPETQRMEWVCCDVHEITVGLSPKVQVVAEQRKVISPVDTTKTQAVVEDGVVTHA